MQRVLVIGCPGAGKSTFSRWLSERSGLPLYHLDRLWHRPDRTTVPRQEFDAALEDILATDRWIIDGHYGRTLPRRLAVCDTVFLLDFPTEVCLDGVRARMGAPRPDMPWTEQEWDPSFEQYIRAFATEQLPIAYDLLSQYPEKRIVLFRTRADVEKFKEEYL